MEFFLQNNDLLAVILREANTTATYVLLADCVSTKPIPCSNASVVTMTCFNMSKRLKAGLNRFFFQNSQRSLRITDPSKD